ncbi:MAG: hypothetical protein J5740_04150 [Bacteroidales bacterium]|nr:hypothetical protein [Bacteroidales bacterium]
MKKLFASLFALVAIASAAFAQEYQPDRALPQKGDIRIGMTWGWNFTLPFEDKNHTNPIMPLGFNADYTFKTFANGQGSLAGGAMFDLLRYSTWHTRDTLTEYGTIKTTTTWTMGLLAATLTGRYCWGQDIEAFGRLFVGKELILGYDEEYSDERYASIVPHTNGPSGSFLAYGLQLGIGTFITDHMTLHLFVGLGSFATLGFNYGYKF